MKALASQHVGSLVAETLKTSTSDSPRPSADNPQPADHATNQSPCWIDFLGHPPQSDRRSQWFCCSTSIRSLLSLLVMQHAIEGSRALYELPDQEEPVMLPDRLPATRRDAIRIKPLSLRCSRWSLSLSILSHCSSTQVSILQKSID